MTKNGGVVFFREVKPAPTEMTHDGCRQQRKTMRRPRKQLVL